MTNTYNYTASKNFDEKIKQKYVFKPNVWAKEWISRTGVREICFKLFQSMLTEMFMGLSKSQILGKKWFRSVNTSVLHLKYEKLVFVRITQSKAKEVDLHCQ